MATITRRENVTPGNEPDGTSNGDSDGNIVDPGAVAAGADTGTGSGDIGGSGTGRRRGRPPGSGRKPGASQKVRAAVLDVPAIQGLLTGIHAMLAGLTDCKELEMSDGEAEALAIGLSNVARHHEFLAGASQKWVDYSNLAIVAGTIYGAKAMMIRRRLSANPAPPKPARGVNGASPPAPVPVTTGPLPGGDLFAVEIPDADIIH